MNNGQSKKMSFLESLINVLIGYGIACTAQAIVFPWFGIHIPLKDNMTIGAIFTIISIARSYMLRRMFNWIHRRTQPNFGTHEDALHSDDIIEVSRKDLENLMRQVHEQPVEIAR